MTVQEAISFLGGDETQIDEFVTQEVFSLKSNLLKGSLVPMVMNKKAEKLSRMADALIILGYEDEHFSNPYSPVELFAFSATELIRFYRDFEQKMSLLKLNLMQSFHPRVVAGILRQMADLESSRLISIYQFSNHINPVEAVKLSDHIDTGSILTELKTVNSQADIYKQLDHLPALKKEINKSVKYCKFVEAKKIR